jgi:hypothetical protein
MEQAHRAALLRKEGRRFLMSHAGDGATQIPRADAAWQVPHVDKRFSATRSRQERAAAVVAAQAVAEAQTALGAFC